ncbi:Rieske (2Fe-2S) protein [Streptomyces sp. NPDC046985]|uniref:Rieske (2Fe-2S) protein n=1 Tax=Streptomyces sp. NPDC046985 TaxID=3155377 RepID=UPI0033F27BE1
MTHGSTRRTVLATSAVALAAAGCGSTDGGAQNSAAASSEPSPAGTSAAGTVPSAGASAAASGAAKKLADVSDIPEGGGKVFADQKVVVTQPAKGRFKAFSAICTHQGCTVAEVADGTIDCPCHGSRYHITDGSVANGPAERPLAERKITVQGTSIRLA